jgi:hypothetical protein
VDNKQQLLSLHEFTAARLPWPKLFIGLKAGERYNGGILARSDEMRDLVNYIISIEEAQSDVLLRGFYCHTAPNGRVHGPDIGTEKLLHEEICEAVKGVRFARDLMSKLGRSFILSMGTTPAANHILSTFGREEAGFSSGLAPIRGILAITKKEGLRVELHAGAYPLLDIQRLARTYLDDRKYGSWNFPLSGAAHHPRRSH